MPGTLKGTLKNQTSVSIEVGILRVYLEYFGSKILQLHVPFFSKKLDLTLLKVQQIQIDENILYTSSLQCLLAELLAKLPNMWTKPKIILMEIHTMMLKCSEL